MKEYNRKTKKWEETTGQGKFKPRDTCRGGRDHDYLLTLPDHVLRYGMKSDITPEMITGYYEHRERERDFMEREDEILGSLGLRALQFRPECSKYYICSVCGKRKYE